MHFPTPGRRRLSHNAILGAAFLLSASPGFLAAAVTLNQAPDGGYLASIAIAGLPAGATGTSTLNPARPVPLLAPPAAGGNFRNTFTADVAQYPGWTAVTGAALAGGTINITEYKATSPAPSPRGGARMVATFTPAVGDTNTYAWIQMFSDNTGAGGATVRHIDPFPNDGIDAGPFYYNSTEGINNAQFVDNPSDPVTSIPFNRMVRFETYLSTYNAATKVATIHDGFAWGYDVVAVPEPSVLMLAAGVYLITFRKRSTR